jgi:glycosyltransferase involved in cell wall biosynthesis
MTPVPTVSVVIPCYNQPDEFLRVSLESVRTQTFDDWEALVVDDGSVVGDAGAVVHGFDDRRIKLLKHERNRGEGAARNTGTTAARSHLIASLDADDRWASQFLEASLGALDGHTDADWVLSDWQLFGASNDTLHFPVPLPPPCPIHFNARSPGLMRKELWQRVGGYAEGEFLTGGVDLDFWLRCVEHGVRVIHIPRLLYWYRIHEGSASATSFSYDTYRINDALYRRHAGLFGDSADCPRCPPTRRAAVYRAIGYRASSGAHLARGDRWRGILLAARALSLDPTDPENLKQLVRAIIPRSARALLGRFRTASRASE